MRALITCGFVCLAGYSLIPQQAAKSTSEAEQAVQSNDAAMAESGRVERVAMKIPAPENFEEAPVENDAFFDMLAAIDRSLEASQNMEAYSALLHQQVRIDETLREPEQMEMKFRRAPFSVYLRWKEDGQEAVFVDGENKGQIIVRPTRGLAALRGIWKLRPDSPQAMKDSRYPITELGIERMSARAKDFHAERDQFHGDLICTASDCQTSEGIGHRYEVVFDSPERAKDYSRSILTFDDQTGLLIELENYGWDGDEPGPLMEHYKYENFEARDGWHQDTFDYKNPEYNFEG